MRSEGKELAAAGKTGLGFPLPMEQFDIPLQLI